MNKILSEKNEELKLEHHKNCVDLKNEIDSFKQNDNERFSFYDEKLKTYKAEIEQLNDEKNSILGDLKTEKANFDQFRENDFKNLQEFLNISKMENNNLESIRSQLEVR